MNQLSAATLMGLATARALAEDEPCQPGPGDYDPDQKVERLGNNRKKLKTVDKRRRDAITKKSRQANRRRSKK